MSEQSVCVVCFWKRAFIKKKKSKEVQLIALETICKIDFKMSEKSNHKALFLHSCHLMEAIKSDVLFDLSFTAYSMLTHTFTIYLP